MQNVNKNDLLLVSGGAGFIGSHLVDSLINNGYKVRVLDNLSPPTHNRKLPDWFNKKCEFIKGDVTSKKDWSKALKNVKYVFHLAAKMDFHLDFSKYMETNAKSTALLYELIVQKNLPIKKVVIASSQSVYGEGKYLCTKHGEFYPAARSVEQLRSHDWEVRCPIEGKVSQILSETEGDRLCPKIPYATSKVASESLALNLGKTYKIPSVLLRYSIVQGSRQSFRHFYSGALRDFCVRAISDLPIILQEDGGQIRDFINIKDVVQAHITVLNNKSADYNAFNVGSGKVIKVKQLAKMVCKIAGKKFTPEYPGLYRVYSPRNSKMNVNKLKKLGWSPQYGVEDSIREYLDWIKGYPEAINYWRKTYTKMKKDDIIKL